MKLELIIDGKERVFTTGFVSARFYKTLAKFDEEIDYFNMSVDEMDRLVGFVCDVFDNQFTVDQVYDGIESHELMSTITDVFAFVRTGKTREEREKEQGNEKGK